MMPRLLIFFIALSAIATSRAQFRFAEATTNSLALWEGPHPVFVYNHGVLSPTNVPADRARSTYVHPLYGLNGEVLTDDFPKDHYHHRGLFWAWPHIQVGETKADLWMLNGIRQQFDRWLERRADQSSATLGVQNFWLLGERKVVQEQVWFRVQSAIKSSRAIDVQLILTPLTEPLILRGAEGKSYGGLSLRFAPHEGEPTITVPAGVTTNDLPIAHLPWADLTAQFLQTPTPAGAAIFIDPGHPDFPPEWLTRHYGVLCVGWPGVTGKEFPVGKPISMRYRVWVHEGVPSLAELDHAYEDYKDWLKHNPPQPAKSD